MKQRWITRVGPQNVANSWPELGWGGQGSCTNIQHISVLLFHNSAQHGSLTIFFESFCFFYHKLTPFISKLLLITLLYILWMDDHVNKEISRYTIIIIIIVIVVCDLRFS